MKKLKTSDISTTVGFPVKSGTLQHIQAAYQEAMSSIIQGLGVDLSKVTILYGCVNSTPGGATFTISAGAVFYNGEIYLVDAATLVTAGPNVVVGVLDTTFFTATNADPVQFTDLSSKNVHEIRKIKLQLGLSGSGISGDTNSNYTNFISTAIGSYVEIPLVSGDGNISTWRNVIATTPTGFTPTYSGSIKYRLVGKTLELNYQIRVSFPGGEQCAAITLNALNIPFKWQGNQWRQHWLSSNATNLSLNGSNPVNFRDGESRIVFNAEVMSDNVTVDSYIGNAFFNYNYHDPAVYLGEYFSGSPAVLGAMTVLIRGGCSVQIQ